MTLCGQKATHRYVNEEGQETFVCLRHAHEVERVIELSGVPWELFKLTADEELLGMFCQEEE